MTALTAATTRSSLTLHVLALAVGASSVCSRLLPAQATSSGLKLPPAFTTLLKARGMVFDTTGFHNFRPTRVMKNKQVMYSFAVKHKTLPLEVRYAVHKVSGGSLAMSSYSLTVLMNLARKGSPDPEILSTNPVDTADVRREYGAETGMVALFVPDPTFSTHKGGSAWFFTNEKHKTLAIVILLFTPGSGDEGFAPRPVLEAMKDIQLALRFKS